MLESAAARIVERLGPDDLVLDIGGWGQPFTRADWVLDLMPYETRGELGRIGPGEERFSAETWVQRDICEREPYPFSDKQFDFVVCAHTLEDIRDPVWVCGEMVRIAKAGYIEVPSRLEEQSYGVQGRWIGWGHHRWLVDVSEHGLEFVFKHHIVARKGNHFPAGFWHALPPELHVQTLWWEGSFDFRERIFIGPQELDPYLADYVREHRGDVPRLRRVTTRLRAAATWRLRRAGELTRERLGREC